MKRFESKIARFIVQNQLLDADGRYLVGLSGGADSVCLLLVLRHLGYNVEAAHCNFLLRGEESDRDELFCAELCEQEGIPFHRVCFDTATYARLHKVSIEMAARDLRYKYFNQLLKDVDFQGICIAHHKDDITETVLMNLVRGTGIHGLTGIKPKRGNIIRPLLCVRRCEIEEYLYSLGQRYMTDSTNRQTDFLRNKIRLRVVPLLQELNASASENIVKTAKRMADAERLYDMSVKCAIEKNVTKRSEEVVSFSIDGLRQNECILYEILAPYGFTSPQIEQIYNSFDRPSGRKWCSESHTAATDRNELIVFASDALSINAGPMKVLETGVYAYTEKVRFRFSIREKTPDFVVEGAAGSSCLDASKVRFPLLVRRVRNGDRFSPYGMQGHSKLVSDYLTGRKKNLYQKLCQLVVTDASERIVWLVNERPDDRFCVDETTSRLLLIDFWNC